jgi:hypothetical protein
MSTAAETVELPAIDKLTDEQKRRLLAILIKDELDRYPIPVPIRVRLDGKDLGQFEPKYTPPAKTTLPPVPEGFWEDLARRMENPGKTFTEEEILALEASGDDGWLLKE